VLLLICNTPQLTIGPATVLDVAVSEIGLQRARVVPGIGEFVAAGVPQHVRTISRRIIWHTRPSPTPKPSICAIHTAVTTLNTELAAEVCTRAQRHRGCLAFDSEPMSATPSVIPKVPETVRCQLGVTDGVLSNTVRVHRKLRQAGVEAVLQVFEGQSHRLGGGQIDDEVELGWLLDRDVGRFRLKLTIPEAFLLRADGLIE
jgi:hypothetical protein